MKLSSLMFMSNCIRCYIYLCCSRDSLNSTSHGIAWRAYGSRIKLQKEKEELDIELAEALRRPVPGAYMSSYMPDIPSPLFEASPVSLQQAVTSEAS